MRCLFANVPCSRSLVPFRATKAARAAFGGKPSRVQDGRSPDFNNSFRATPARLNGPGRIDVEIVPIDGWATRRGVGLLISKLLCTLAAPFSMKDKPKQAQPCDTTHVTAQWPDDLALPSPPPLPSCRPFEPRSPQRGEALADPLLAGARGPLLAGAYSAVESVSGPAVRVGADPPRVRQTLDHAAARRRGTGARRAAAAGTG